MLVNPEKAKRFAQPSGIAPASLREFPEKRGFFDKIRLFERETECNQWEFRVALQAVHVYEARGNKF